MSAGVSSPPNDPCFYGVSRTRCKIGCGIQCRPARRAHTNMMQRVARIVEEDAGILQRLSDVPVFTASPSVAAEHPHCGSAKCCKTC